MHCYALSVMFAMCFVLGCTLAASQMSEEDLFLKKIPNVLHKRFLVSINVAIDILWKFGLLVLFHVFKNH